MLVLLALLIGLGTATAGTDDITSGGPDGPGTTITSSAGG